MDFRFTVKDENIEYMAEKFSALKNPTALKIILVLEKESLTLDEIHNQIKKEGHKYRDWTYRLLEKLVEADLVVKDYDNEKKKIVYTLKRSKW